MNKYFLKLLPPQASDNILHNVMSYVYSILGRLLTLGPGQGI